MYALDIISMLEIFLHSGVLFVVACAQRVYGLSCGMNLIKLATITFRTSIGRRFENISSSLLNNQRKASNFIKVHIQHVCDHFPCVICTVSSSWAGVFSRNSSSLSFRGSPESSVNGGLISVQFYNNVSMISPGGSTSASTKYATP